MFQKAGLHRTGGTGSRLRIIKPVVPIISSEDFLSDVFNTLRLLLRPAYTCFHEMAFAASEVFRKTPRGAIIPLIMNLHVQVRLMICLISST